MVGGEGATRWTSHRLPRSAPSRMPRWTEHETSLIGGETLLLYTDGLVERPDSR